MTDERIVDEHLGAVLNSVLDAVYQAKQAAWSAPSSPAKDDLQELVAFLIDKSAVLMVAEESIDGRSASISSPSSHQRGNLVGEAGGDIDGAIAALVRRLDDLAEDARMRAAAITDCEEAPMLTTLADGLQARAARLRAD